MPSESTVSSRIREARDEYELRTGGVATRLYLSPKAKDEFLREDARIMGGRLSASEDPDGRERIFGMVVYDVGELRSGADDTYVQVEGGKDPGDV